MSHKLTPKQARKFWRIFFRELFVGDRVSIPDYERRGYITKKFWVPGNVYVPIPHWEYEVEFDHAMKMDPTIFPKGERFCGGFAGVCFQDMKFIR